MFTPQPPHSGLLDRCTSSSQTLDLLHDGLLHFGVHDLGDHGESEHGILLYREVLHVPLFLKLPRAERGGTRVARPVGLVSVLPTVAALVGAPIPAEVRAGRSGYREVYRSPGASWPLRATYSR